jgi:histidinol phosphatase-like PHP family hydrolase
MVLQIDRIDLHIHTSYSDGTCGVDEVAKLAQSKKINIFAVTDHYSEFQSLPKRMPKGRLNAYLDSLNRAGVIKGVEVEILSEGVSISKRSAGLCDLVLGGLHILNNRVFWGDERPISNPKSFVEDVRVTLIRAIESDLIDVIVHPTWLPKTIRAQTKQLITQDWIESIVGTASKHKVAIEISGAWKVPDEPFVLECLRQGVKLSIGSDAHAYSMIGKVGYAIRLIARVNAPLESIYLPTCIRDLE